LAFFTFAGSTAVTTIKDFYRLELRQKGIKLCAYHGLGNMLAAAGEAACEGGYYVDYVPTQWDTEIPGVKLLRELVKRYRGWDRLDPTYMYGWAGTQVAVESISLAIEKVGYDNLSGRAIRDALASMVKNDLGGIGIIPPVTMSEEQPYFAVYLRIYRIQQGQTIVCSDWLKPVYPTTAG